MSSRILFPASCIALAALLSACGNSDGTARQSAANQSIEPGEVTSTMDFGYEVYNELLAAYVDAEGFVDYAGLQTRRADLDAFVASMGTLDPAEFAALPEAERLAFWMNAYNAITLQYILDNYPIKKGGLVSGALYPANSIRQIDGVWDELTTFVVGRALTLEDIEHEILRKEFDEPRLHVAIVCASVGCPPLRAEAFEAANLEEQLADQSRVFIGHPDKFRIDRAGNTVYLSPIFDWFGKDFVSRHTPSEGFSKHDDATRAVLNYASAYLPEADGQYLRSHTYAVKYSNYDWSLNER